jgi:hypothetical protein
MQTNDIIILGNMCFSVQEKQKLNYTNYTIKPKKKLLIIILLLFNSYIFSLDGTNINICQKGQANKLQTIDNESSDTY